MTIRTPLSNAAQRGAEHLRKYLDSLPHGGVARLAEEIRTNPTYLCRLASGDRTITAEWVLKISRATSLSPHELRPDLFDSPQDNKVA